MVRPIPAYLALVPPAGKRFRRPRRSVVPTSLTRSGDEVGRIVRQAERLEAIVRRLHQAVFQDDEIAARALASTAEIEVRYAAMLARSMRDGTSCA